MSRATPSFYYELTVKEIQEAIDSQLLKIAQRREELLDWKRRLTQVAEDVSIKLCPICGKRMLNIGCLVAIGDQIRVDGAASTTLIYNAEIYEYRVPQDWECQGCGGFDTSAPRNEICQGRWNRQDSTLRGKTLAATVFKHFPQVDEVAYETGSIKGRSDQPGWLLRVGKEWYFYEGTKQEVLHQLGID